MTERPDTERKTTSWVAHIDVEFDADSEDEAAEWVRGRTVELFDRDEVHAVESDTWPGALSADTEAPPLTEREETTASDGSDSGTPDERLRGTAVPPRTTSRSVSGADTEARTPEQVSIPDTCGDLPPDLVRVLRDPTITIQRDHEIRLADGRTLFEHLQEWRNAPSNTASADTEAGK